MQSQDTRGMVIPIDVTVNLKGVYIKDDKSVGNISPFISNHQYTCV